MSDATNTDVASGVVLTIHRGRALWICINREQKRNTLNPEVIEGIHQAVRSAGTDPQLRAIVLTAVGRKAFCAGADLGLRSRVFADELTEPTTDFGRLARSFRELGLPTIARINGDCVAGGMGLMALCDLAVAADHARFGLPEAKVGVFPMQVLVYLRRMLHPRHVNELCLTGKLIDAGRARGIGIANQVVPYDQLDATVDEMVARLSDMSPSALKRGKAAIAAMEAMSHAEALAFAEAQIAITSLTADAREGLAAFNEKRKPRWAIEGDAQ
jgi:methylglutaconyl-CoA hydratase